MIDIVCPPGVAVVPFAPWHICAIEPRGPDAETIKRIDRMAYGRMLASTFQCQTALLNMQPIACWGLCEYPPHTLVGFFAADVALNRYPVSIWKWSRAIIAAAMNQPEVRRIEFNVDPESRQSCAWLERLGFVKEGLRRSYGPNGEDFFMYAKVNV